MFHGNFHLHPYIFSTALSPSKYRRDLEFPDTYQAPTPPQSDQLTRLRFVVGVDNGVTVLDLSGAPELSGRKKDQLRKKMEQTAGEWIAQRHS